MLLVGLAFGLFFVVEEDEAKDKQTKHHGKGAGVVRISGGYESIILSVLLWTDRHLKSKTTC